MCTRYYISSLRAVVFDNVSPVVSNCIMGNDEKNIMIFNACINNNNNNLMIRSESIAFDGNKLLTLENVRLVCAPEHGSHCAITVKDPYILYTYFYFFFLRARALYYTRCVYKHTSDLISELNSTFPRYTRKLFPQAVSRLWNANYRGNIIRIVMK